MPQTSSSIPATRKPRADAQRNRERILSVARVAFGEHGPEASLDDIARAAKVGPGTLYRHFPSREVLIEAVFRSEVEALVRASERYAATMTSVEALRAWMRLFIEYVAAKLLILPAMDTLPGGSQRLIEGTRGQIQAAFSGLIQRAVKDGSLREDTQPDDLIQAFFGIFRSSLLTGWDESARRIVNILIDGSRPR